MTYEIFIEKLVPKLLGCGLDDSFVELLQSSPQFNHWARKVCGEYPQVVDDDRFLFDLASAIVLFVGEWPKDTEQFSVAEFISKVEASAEKLYELLDKKNLSRLQRAMIEEHLFLRLLNTIVLPHSILMSCKALRGVAALTKLRIKEYRVLYVGPGAPKKRDSNLTFSRIVAYLDDHFPEDRRTSILAGLFHAVGSVSGECKGKDAYRHQIDRVRKARS